MLSTLAQLKEAAPRTATLADWSVTFGQWFRAIKWASEHSHIDACSRPWQRFADLLPEMGQLGARGQHHREPSTERTYTTSERCAY